MEPPEPERAAEAREARRSGEYSLNLSSGTSTHLCYVDEHTFALLPFLQTYGTYSDLCCNQMHNWNMQQHTSMLKSRIQKHISGNNSGNIYGCFCYLELPCQIYEAATRNFNGISGKETAFSSRLVMYFSAGSKLHRNFKIVSVPYGLPFKMMRNQLKLPHNL